jgi:predicted permease
VSPRAALSRIRAHFSAKRHDARLAEEIATHIDALAADYQRRGLTPDAARFAARRDFGNVTATQENHRAHRTLPFLETLAQDLRYAFRQMRAKPGFTAAAVFTLALGIGANTAIFRVLDAVVLSSLPVKNPEELVLLVAKQNGKPVPVSYPLFREMSARQHELAGMFAANNVDPGVDPAVDPAAASDGSAPRATLVTGRYFELLGARAQIGRTIVDSDDQPGTPPVAVIGYGYWQRVFGGKAAVLGRAIRINGASAIIVGVAERGFFGERVGSAPDVWLPMNAQPLVWPGHTNWLTSPANARLQPMGRVRPGLSPGVSRARSEAALTALYSQLHELSVHGLGPTVYTIELAPGSQGFGDLQKQFSAPLAVLMGIAGIVLLLACCNLANLLLANASARTHEMGIRLAVGAGRSRLLRQLLTESAALAVIGGAVGFVLAQQGSRALVDFASAGRGWRLSLDPDWRILAFTAAVSLLAAAIFGLVPAFTAVRLDPNAALKTNRRNGGLRSANGAARAFIVAQVAASLVLVAGAALLVRSFRNLETQDFGYRQQGLLLLEFRLDSNLFQFRDPARIQQVHQRLNAIPGVMSAALSGRALSSWLLTQVKISLSGQATPAVDALLSQVSPHYFETMKIPLLAGREFSEPDRKQTAPVAVLSEAAARQLFGSANPVGRSISVGPNDSHMVVGIVHDIRLGPREPFVPVVYEPMAQNGVPLLTAVLRTAGDPAAFASAARQAVRESAPTLKLQSVSPVTELLGASIRQERTVAVLSAAFGLLALVLASVGLYGVIAYAVQRRTQEIGIRIALGASRIQVTGLLLSDIAHLLAIGLIVGLAGTLALGNWVRSLLFGITPHDPAMLAAAAAILTAVAFAAGYLPARRASRLHPIEALRQE